MTSDRQDGTAGPVVGIVIPAYNAADFIAETLHGILAQTYGAWRCVVVDDGSSDGTVAAASAAARDDHRIEIVEQANAGPVVARNLGFELIEEAIELVTFMDADDVWRPDALAKLVDAMRGSPGVIGAHGLADFIDELGQPLSPGEFAALGRNRLGCRGGRPRHWPVDRPTTFENVIVQSILFPPGLIVACSRAYRAIGLWDERHRDADDWEVLMRLVRLGDLAFVDEVILGYRRHASNLGAGDRRAKGCAEARRAVYFSPLNTPRQQVVVKDAWRAAQILDAKARLSEALGLLRRGKFVPALATLTRLPLLAGRFVRGRPPYPVLR